MVIGGKRAFRAWRFLLTTALVATNKSSAIAPVCYMVNGGIQQIAWNPIKIASHDRPVFLRHPIFLEMPVDRVPYVESLPSKMEFGIPFSRAQDPFLMPTGHEKRGCVGLGTLST